MLPRPKFTKHEDLNDANVDKQGCKWGKITKSADEMKMTKNRGKYREKMALENL